MDEQTTQNQTPPAPQAGGNDAEKNKAMAIVGYIIPILFFIPLVTDAKNSPFAKFHANQQLLLLIAAVIVNILGGAIPILGWFIILPLGCIFLLVMAIMGIISAAKGEMKPLPLIGSIHVIK
ncbi:MAG TPA: hypothetical protein P5262_02830 [Candidatus Moranbacteria bacterium]|nr:hypothetical protein [Candidatus Moranbacteria bacterium]